MLSAALTKRGHTVTGLSYQSPSAPEADLNIFDEIVNPDLIRFAPRSWVMPHPEWWYDEWDQYLPRFEKVLAKTQDCYKIFKAIAPQTEHIGWRSRDLRDEGRRERTVIHVAGLSRTKNTEAVIQAWRTFKGLPRLTIVSQEYKNPRIWGVKHYRRVPDLKLKRLMNANLIHLLPSAYEGWGHSLHEALGIGAVIVTIDAPSMNEIGAPVLIPPSRSYQLRHALAHEVSPADIAQAVRTAASLSPADVHAIAHSARSEFEAEAIAFESRLDALLSGPQEYARS